jgi:hypothetical protein
MTIREQIVTVKITYDDLEEQACPLAEQANCCGEGLCEETREKPSDALATQLECCYRPEKVEILQATEPREVISGSSFE